MNSATVKIHEFSTGIQAERTSDGGWVSRGFTGQYINKTLDSIPANVESAISNREFAVSEGASRDNPAIIGREVRGGDQDWSVIAVVTKGGDDRGRSASMYRYFLCEGAGNLWKILAWIYSQPQERPMPVFNPFETKVVGQPNEYQVGNPLVVPLKNELQYLLKNEAPIVIPSVQPCTAFIVNQMAMEKARENGQPVAWAFQAEALEQPRSFLVIQPASEKAEQLLHRAIASTPQYTAPITGEYEIKSAIKGLISRENVKLEQVQAIETALNQVQDSDWEVIFNAQGAAQARSQGIYSPQMVRLLTLRAIVLPETLPEFLSWMQKRGKQEDHYQVSETFQSEIKSSIKSIFAQESNLSVKVIQGVKLIIPRLIDKPELLNATVWLLNYSEGIWQQFYNEIVSQEIENNLRLTISLLKHPQNKQFHLIDDDGWKKILGELKLHLQQRSVPQDKYLPLAELFRDLEQTEMAAFFYQLSLGCVPKKTFAQLNHGGWNSNVFAYGMRVKKQVSYLEFLFGSLIKLGGKKVPVAFVIILLILTFFGGFWSGGALKSSKKPGQSPTPYSDNSRQSDLPNFPNYKRDGNSGENVTKVITPNEVAPNDFQSKPEYQEGMTQKRFKKTIDSIDKIVIDISRKKPEKSDEDILTALKEVLDVRELDYDKAKSDDKEEKQKLVRAIFIYQKKKFDAPFGYIDDSTVKTINSLKTESQSKL